CEGHACAVFEVRIANTCFQKCLATLFEPRSVVDIVWIELFQQELVPDITALIERTCRADRRWRIQLLPMPRGCGWLRLCRLLTLGRCHGDCDYEDTGDVHSSHHSFTSDSHSDAG